jgi:predicted transcriptional regulator
MHMTVVNYQQPTECGLSKAAVDSLAERLALQVGYEPGTPLEPVVQKLGGRITVQNAWDAAEASSGSIKIRSDSDFEIFLPLHTGPIRDRFTIAHEIGHYVLHYLWPKSQGKDVGPIEVMRYGTGRVEWEANWFAAGFLMPAAAFKLAHTRFSGDLASLSSEFKVSMEAARIRVQSLELI